MPDVLVIGSNASRRHAQADDLVRRAELLRSYACVGEAELSQHLGDFVCITLRGGNPYVRVARLRGYP